MVLKSQSTFIALFVYLTFALSSLFLSKKNAWSYFLILRRKTSRFCRSFHISCTFSFRTAHGNRRRWALLSCSLYFVRIPLPFKLSQQCNKIYRLTSKRLLFWCYSPCSEDSEKDSCSNKIKTTCYNTLSIICCTCRHWKRHNRLMKRIISYLQFFSMLSDLQICNVLALATTSCSVQYGYEIFMFEHKCHCDN